MTNLEWLKKLQKDDDGLSDIETSKYEFRQAKALEIIAEELIDLVNVLENIDNNLDRR